MPEAGMPTLLMFLKDDLRTSSTPPFRACSFPLKCKTLGRKFLLLWVYGTHSTCPESDHDIDAHV